MSYQVEVSATGR